MSAYTTVKDLVTEVAEQSSGMSDFVYDEKSSMYYCKSNGYYYDPIKKLLYDPRSRIYYLYIQETLSYEFYCKADAISDIPDKETKQEKKYNKHKARKKFWKKKQQESAETEKGISSDKKEDIFEEDADAMNDGFSSPEAGEIFSSDSDSESLKENSTKEESSPCSPCIRAIVECSSKLKVGSLILITCTGAVIGRDHFSTIHIPDISVSKIHAEVTFDNESWKYSVEDLGSQNGTFVNEMRLSEPKQKSKPQLLSHGDKIAFGSCKFLIHIHDGHETCDKCEPGQVMAELTSKEVKLVPVLKTKLEKERERRQEIRRLKKRYGLEDMEYSDTKCYISTTDSKYEDKAEIRRQTVGSENPYEKTEVASMDVILSESNKGYQMLKKLGWKEGDSLGLSNSGISHPIPIRPWVHKAGLGSTDMNTSGPAPPEDKRKRKWVKAQERYFQLKS
ncbi:angiogenic factor with G patch and FHA domains 1 [Nephila pilipes]|uniref:Angiogenic factor with G patch and FHA domains 1 n=1 Tax=Nephila pilipes TaxID=299642 RepID=A0A8X6TDW7_NEPPI|nr:angiogenic factor with G patch and FHA domains 1 [Nephila pilipes]